MRVNRRDANIQPPSPGRKWKTVLWFSKARRAVFCTGLLEARAPIQGFGLTVVDQGHHRAALDVNDLWIPDVGAQHPVESYGQLARRCHFGHSFGLAVATVLILFTRNPSSRRTTECAASTSVCRRKRLPCLEIAPSRCRPPELCSRGISPR